MLNSVRYGSTVIFSASIVLIAIIVLLTFTSCNIRKNTGLQSGVASVSTSNLSNHDTDSDSFDINVNISYKIILDDKVKGADPNIIRATRQAIFDYDVNNAKFFHYKGYVKSNDIYIFEVEETSKNTWLVKYWQKPQGQESYNKQGYAFAAVEKQESGSFIGKITTPGGPSIIEGITY